MDNFHLSDLLESLVEIKGAVHIHTQYSDGDIEAREVISAAQTVGLDFLVFTDHMTLQAKNEGFEQFHNDLFTLVGYEHNDNQEKNHYLVFGVDAVEKEQDSPQKYIQKLKKAGGIGFLAHPSEVRNYFKKYPSYPWTDWSVTDFDGIEIWNQMSEWVENLRSWLSFIYIFYPRRFIQNAPINLLHRWDEYNRKQFVSGIGGVDAHTFHIKKGFIAFKIFPIKVELKGIRTHLYVDKEFCKRDFSTSKKIFLEAIKQGNGFISNFRRGDATGTVICLTTSDGKAFPPGKNREVVELPATFYVSIPDRAEINLIKNGRIVQQGKGTMVEFDVTDPGLYRIEIFKGKNAWIYSNPFPIGKYPLY